MASVNTVSRPRQQQREQKVDPLDRILKGLQIAQGIFGIKSNLDKIEQGSLQNEQRKQELVLKQERNKFLEQDALRRSELTQQGQLKPFQFIDDQGQTRTGIFDPSKGEEGLIIPKDAPLSAKGLISPSQQAAVRGADLREQQEQRRIGIIEKEKNVPGLGKAKTKLDAKQAKDAIEQFNNLKFSLGKMEELRAEFGSEVFNRSAVARGKVLGTDLLLSFKDMAKLGVLSQSDEALLAKLVPSDPLQIDFTGSTDSQLKQLNELVENKIGNFLNSRGFDPDAVQEALNIKIQNIEQRGGFQGLSTQGINPQPQGVSGLIPGQQPAARQPSGGFDPNAFLSNP